MTLALLLHSTWIQTASADELENTCGAVIARAQASPSSASQPQATATANPAGSEAYQQKLQYCQAAKSAQESADANSAMWKVWASVSAVCTYACIASFAGGPTSEFLCMGASVAGGVTDAVLTRNFVGALMSIGSAGMGYMANQAMNPAQTAAAEVPKAGMTPPATPPKKDFGACLGAATAAVQVFTKVSSMNSSEDSVKSNLESARKVTSNTEAVAQQQGPDFTPSAALSSNPNDNTRTGSGNYNAGVSNGSVNDSSNVTATCASARATNSASGTLQCAVASDRTLPSFVKDPRFPKEFQKNTGQSLSNFLAKNDRPSSMLSGAMGNGLSATQAAKLASGLSDLERGVGVVEPSNSAYSGGGGAASGGGGEEDPMAGIQDMMAGLMDQMNPNKKAEDKKTGVSAVVFANRNRSPASVAEDRTLSIFARVSYRYYYVGPKLEPGPQGEQTK